MPQTRSIKQSFIGGIVTPELFGRFDLDKYSQGAEILENFLVLPQGPAVNRSGFRFVNEVKDSTKATRLIPFSFSATQTFCIELGEGYFRFHSLGGTLLNGAVPYEVANSYLESELFEVDYEQSGDVITLTHKNHPPAELRRITNLNWTFTTISFSPTIATPTGAVATATQPNPGTNEDFKYTVTAVDAVTLSESYGATVTPTIQNDLTITGNFNTITWNAVPGAIRYNVYKFQNGVFGYIGQTTALTLFDENISADTGQVIPIVDIPFQSAGNYPRTVGHYEQRRIFASTIAQPANVWMSVAGTESDMSYRIPSIATDSVRFRISAANADSINHIITLQDIIMLTASTEWKVSAPGTGGLSADNITIQTQSDNGSTAIKPALINNYAIYEQAQSGHLREMSFQWQTQTYDSNDISLIAPGLFDFKTIKQLAHTRAPYSIVWAVSSDGSLLGLTYVPEQKVAAWHRHTTDGTFESVTTVTENGEDATYVVVRRLINGFYNRYVEVLDRREYLNLEDNFFVDSGLTYSGAPATTITGLDHLEGKTVAVLGDGAVQNQKVVSGGAITLDTSASKVHVGLPITAIIKTLPLTFQDTAFGQSRVKNVNAVYVRVANSATFKAGPTLAKLTEIKGREFEQPGDPVSLKTGEFKLVISPTFDQTGEVYLVQDRPLPLTVVYTVLDVSIGG